MVLANGLLPASPALEALGVLNRYLWMFRMVVLCIAQPEKSSRSH